MTHLAPVMLSKLKRQWGEIRMGKPGHRFRAQFERNERAKAGKSFLRRWMMLFVAAMVLMIGIVLLFIPGPGIPFVILGASMLAEQFRPAANALDSLEVQLRKMARRGRGWWHQSSISTKGASALLVVATIGSVGYGAFHVVFRG